MTSHVLDTPRIFDMPSAATSASATVSPLRLRTTIRHIKPDDIAAFFALLIDKARFDGCPDALLATEASVRANLFAPHPKMRALVAIADGKLVGMATYHAIFSTFLMRPGLWLDDLYLDEPYRGNGLGRALIARLCVIAEEQGCARLDWNVATQNDAGKRFYRSLGADISDEVQCCRLTITDIAALARIDQRAGAGNG